MPMVSYAVVLTFPEQIERELDILREPYKTYVGYTIPPHITLKFPFILRTDLGDARERLEFVADNARPLHVVLDGVRYFEGDNNVAYVAIGEEKPIRELHSHIHYALEGIVSEEYEELRGFVLDGFIPHVTVGEHIPDEVFPAVKKTLENHRIRYEARLESFHLYSQADDRIWRPAEEFNLSG